MNRKLICQILNHEMMLATGCTEPAAIALTAAIAREQLDGELEHIKVRASANIIKYNNLKSLFTLGINNAINIAYKDIPKLLAIIAGNNFTLIAPSTVDNTHVE